MTARTQHAPGPWQVNDNTLGEFSILNSRGDMRVATVAFGQVADTANARLIAAAPDLLAACEAAEGSLDVMATTLARPIRTSKTRAGKWTLLPRSM